MRVAFLTPWNEPCGIADYSEQLARAIRALPDAPEIRVIELSPRYRQSLLSALWRRSADLDYYRKIGKRLNDSDLAHIQFQYPLFGGFAPWKLKFGAVMEQVKVPVVLTMHELEYKSAPAGGPMNFFQRQNYVHNSSIVTWPQIKAVIVHTNQLVQPLEELMVPREIVYVQAMPVPDIGPLPSQDEAKARLGLTGKQVLAILGFVVKRKGYETAAIALRLLPEDVVLAAVGGPSPFDRTGYFNQLSILANALRLPSTALRTSRSGRAGNSMPSKVILTGYLKDEEFRNWLAAADVILAPFEEMAGSSSIALAIAAEKPIIASDLPQIVEMRKEFPCLATFPRSDPAMLADACRVVLEDLNGARRRLVEAVREYKSKFHVSNIARDTVQIYRHVLQAVKNCLPERP